jgi:diguanylate cyclase (GGDEF)-like protein
LSETGRDTSGVTTRLIVAYVRRHLGDEGVAQLLERAGDTRPVPVLEDERSWSTYDQKIALFEAAASLTGDPEVARRIGASVLKEQLGAVLRAVIGALGSPQRVLKSVARANVKFSTSSTMHAMEVGRASATVTYRLHEGHVPSRHDCNYTQGILSQVTVLFGRPPAMITHGQCQVDGADECVYVVRWRRLHWWTRGVARRRAGLAEGALQERVKDLELTVAELVAAEDLEASLTRIAARAAAAVHGQRHLLAVRVGDRQIVHGDGLGDVQAEDLGGQLLRTGSVELPGFEALVAPVASARRTYGWLAAFLPAETGFLPAEQEHLDAYAGLAAAALDVGTSLQEARRSGEVSSGLLTLGRQLAHESNAEAVAQRVAQAVPLVTDSVRASVLRWDPVAGRLSQTAAVGFGEMLEDAMAVEVEAASSPFLSELLRDPTARRYDLGMGDPGLDGLLARFGDSWISVAPIVASTAFLGVVVASHHQAPSADADRDDRDLGARTLAGLADQAGIALARLQLLHEARHAATHDHLTGLADRALFHDRVERALLDGRRSSRLTAVCFLDLDGFKAVNDTYGHPAGDALLVEVAARIRRTVRETDSVSRIAGDEFAVLLRDLEDPGVATRVAEALVAAIRRPSAFEAHDVAVGVSIGIALGPDQGATAAELLKAADRAMYQAKRRGGGWHLAGTEVVAT